MLGVFKFGADASISFATTLAIVIYGSLPWVIHALLGILSMIAGWTRRLQRAEPCWDESGIFHGPGGNKFVMGMASAFDIFAIWSIVLIGIGFACNSRVKRSTAIGLVAGMFFLYKLFGASLAALFS